MGFITSKTKSNDFIEHNKIIIKKIILSLLILILVITLFSTTICASEINDVETNSDEADNVKGNSPISKFSNTIRDFINQRWTSRKWLPPLRLVTRYQKDEFSPIIEKSARMRLVLPTSIDVNGDHIRDIRVWIIRRPALDLNPPALCIKTTYLIRRLPGMENIKNDFFEIYLEYNPKIITKFFYLTKDIDRIRVGYQSPAGEEIPKTCIVVDKTVPHFLYPMKKTTHKISVNPYSIVGKEQMNLLFALADLENGTVKSELIMQVNYTPAVRVGEIIFEREKNKLFGRGQSLKIKRTGVRPSNVTLFIKELTWRNRTILKQGSITVENMPREINLEWLIGRTGYIGIDTHNDEVGRVRAVFNNTVVVGFVPETSMHSRISWEDRTLIGVLAPEGFELGGLETFNLSFDIHEYLVLEDFSLKVTNQENASFHYLLETTASSLSLDLDTDIDFGNVTAEYWLLPIEYSYDTTINMGIKNLKLVAENFAVNVEVAAEVNTSEESINDSSNVNIFAEYFEVSAEDAHIYSSPYTIKATNEAEGIIDMHVKDADFSITEIVKDSSSTVNGSFSSLDISTSSAYSKYELFTNPHGPEMWWIWSEISGMSIVVNGSFELNDFSFHGDNFLAIEAFKGFGNFSYNTSLIRNGSYFDVKNTTTNTNIEGSGVIEIQKIHFDDKQNNIFMIDEFSVSLEGVYSEYYYKDPGMSTSTNYLKGNGDIVISKYYSKNSWNDTIEWDLLQLSGEISFSTNSTNSSSNSSYCSKIFATGTGIIKRKNFIEKLSYNNITTTTQIGEFNLLLEGTYLENNYKDPNTSTSNIYLNGNGTVEIINLDQRDGLNKITKSYTKDSLNNILKWELFRLSGQDLYFSKNSKNVSLNYVSLDYSSYSKIFATGIVTIEWKNFFERLSDGSITEIDEFYLSLEGTYSDYQHKNSTSHSIEMYLEGNGNVKIKKFCRKSSVNELSKWDLLYFSGEGSLYTNSLSDSPYDTEITSFGNGTFEIRNFSSEYYGKIDQVDLFRIYGEYMFTNNPLYGILSFEGDLTVEARNFFSTIKSFYCNVNGDLTVKGYDGHLMLISENGFAIGHLFIDVGEVRTLDLAGTAGPGYLHVGWGGQWKDSFLFADSSEIDFIDWQITVNNTVNNIGIRLSASTNDFDADFFLIQWDTMTLDLPRLRAIPYNFYKTGKISRERDIKIEIIYGNKYLQLWPLEDFGNYNEETEGTEETSYNGGYVEPLGNIFPPNKPCKPKGPTGGVVVGRIVKGSNYTFTTTTTNNDDDQYVAYKWDWGDGTYSSWSPFIKSGIWVTGSHIWTELGTYDIRVKAKNIIGEESEWSDPLKITVRKKIINENQNEIIEENSIVLQQNNRQNNPNNN
jgi:hypothetical protein